MVSGLPTQLGLCIARQREWSLTALLFSFLVHFYLSGLRILVTTDTFMHPFCYICPPFLERVRLAEIVSMLSLCFKLWYSIAISHDSISIELDTYHISFPSNH